MTYSNLKFILGCLLTMFIFSTSISAQTRVEQERIEALRRSRAANNNADRIGGGLSLISGSWANENASTGNISRFSINSDASTIHPFGACSPQECDWGELPMRRLLNLNIYSVDVDQGFAKRKMTITAIDNNRIKLVVKTDFTDSRADYETTEYFKRAESQSPQTYTWFNEDANTRGLTKAIIRHDFTYFHGFGSCSPRDCDWGTVPMTRLRGCTDCFKADYDFGFSTKLIVIDRLSSTRIRVTSITDFNDPNRTDSRAIYYLRKQATP